MPPEEKLKIGLAICMLSIISIVLSCCMVNYSIYNDNRITAIEQKLGKVTGSGGAFPAEK